MVVLVVIVLLLRVVFLATEASRKIVPEAGRPLPAAIATPAPSAGKLVASASAEVFAPQKVVLLYQKGDGESDLLVLVVGEISREKKGLASFHYINTLEEPQMAEFYGISTLPALIYLSPSGKVLFKHEGYQDKEKIIAEILKSRKN